MAGRRIADLLIKIGADSYEFKQKTQQVERDFDSLSKKLDKVGKELSLKLTAPLTALGVVALNNADIQQQAEQRLLTALKGRSDIQQRLLAEAGELQARSTLGDEAIIGQQAYLASLGMTEEQIGRVIEASAQLSYATGMTLDSAVKNLAKTYGGLTGELGESIPKLKELTTEQLKNGEAVDFILENYKGFAEAAAETGIGPIKQLKNTWGDFLEQIGAIIMPIAAKVAGALSSVVAVLQAMDPRWQKLLVSVAAVAAAIGPLCLLLGSLSKALPLLKTGFAMLVAPIGLVKTGIHALTAAIAANPIGLLLTLITTGISLFIAFGDSAEDAAEKNGELTNKIIEEARQVNALVGKLSSANTSEQERKAALEELKGVQPQIVEGLSAEALELETLRKRAAEYNQQLVLHIALARKQDQVTAAIERQTEAGVRQAEKEAELYAYLSDIGAKLASGDFEFGRHNQNKGFYEWKQASEQLQSSLVNHFNEIMAGGDSLAEKARRVQQMFQPQVRYGDKIRMDDVSMRKINRMRSDVRELGEEVTEAGDLVSQAEAEVRNFAEAFSLSLTSAVEDASTSVDGLSGAADGASMRTQKSIEELNEEIKSLEAQKQKSFDPTEIAGFNRQIAELRREVDRLNGLGTSATQAMGKITALQAEIKKLETQKQAAFDVEEIAACNARIEELKKEIDELNKVLPQDLLPREPLAPILPDGMTLVMPQIEIKPPDLKPIVTRAMEQMKAIRELVWGEVFGWADEVGGKLEGDIRDIEQVVATYTEALVSKGWEFGAALEQVGGAVRETIQSFDQSLSTFLANSIVAAAEAIGQIMAGDLGFGGLMKAILLQFANFLKQIGSQMIQFGVMIIAFKSALKSVLANPWAAIAIGAAMVAAAAVMTALINKQAKENAPKLAKGGLAFGPTYAMVGDNPNAGVDPEVIAPLSKLKEMMVGGGTTNVNITLSGELTAKGRDLVYAIGKENFKTNILGR
ncbi:MULTISPECIES: hypothetical protein [Alistipes]|uniref:hypothetical protein n=1 Tax=Alistipes TaxID=239759 RepID=UPI001B3946AB|nr:MULTISPECIES: hypothetical protein [Alistipes]MBQ4902314.1 hypothetical protein [Alistipes sp. Marseille-P2263]MCI2257588.1 hypothetical protein [Alistipes dispar]